MPVMGECEGVPVMGECEGVPVMGGWEGVPVMRVRCTSDGRVRVCQWWVSVRVDLHSISE